MKRVPRPNIRKRRGRQWNKLQRKRRFAREAYRWWIWNVAIPKLATATGTLAAALDAEAKIANERLLAAGGTPRNLRIPFAIRPSFYEKKETTE